MRVIIVEDEAVIARRLARLLREIGGIVGPIEIVSDFAAAGALAAARGDSLVFLDLNLHGRDGFDLLRQGLANGWRTVVVSAHAERAIEAFELGVVDFVPKPFTRERLALALSRATASAPDGRLRYLAALQGSGTTLVRLDEIVAIHGADDYSEIEVADGRRLLHRKSLQRLGGELPPSFVRVHRSHIVNLDRVLGLDRTDGGAWHLRLEDGGSLPVGRRALGELRKRLG
jgi:two-component system response regulator LytT